MTPAALAKALRRRQLRARLQPKALINRLSDAEILDCYVRCCRCRREIFEDLGATIGAADSTEAFIAAVNEALGSHRCGV